MSGKEKTGIEEFEDAEKEMSPEERALAEGLDIRGAIIANRNAIKDFDRLGYNKAALEKELDIAEKNIDSIH